MTKKEQVERLGGREYPVHVDDGAAARSALPAGPAAPQTPSVMWLLNYHGITAGHLEVPAWKDQIENEQHLISAYLRASSPSPSAALRQIIQQWRDKPWSGMSQDFANEIARAIGDDEQ